MASLPILQPEPIAPLPQREPVPRRKPKIVRRRGDRSQALRSAFQLAFLLLNLWIGLQFLMWVRYYESGGRTFSVSRPAGVEGWLPIASLMNLKAWVLSGDLPAIHPAGVFLILAFMTVSVLYRSSFCSWLCPVGTVSEAAGDAGKRLFGRNFLLPKWIDRGLRSLKYVLLSLFVYAVGSMGVAEIRHFLDGPYGIIADVKMLDFFRRPSSLTLGVVGFLVLASFLVRGSWCRYLCPYGALMGLLGRFSPTRIRRNADACIDCGKCSQACGSRIPVDQLVTVRSAECTGCLRCVAACPSRDALAMTVLRRPVTPAWIATGIAVIFLGLVLAARLTGHWHTDLPEQIYFELVPAAQRFSHP